MSNRERKARKAEGRKLERTAKVPTARHLTPKEKQVLRREAKRLDGQVESLVDKLARQVREQNAKGEGS